MHSANLGGIPIAPSSELCHITPPRKIHARGGGGAGGRHISCPSKSHRNTLCHTGCSHSSEVIVRPQNKGQRCVTFNLNMRLQPSACLVLCFFFTRSAFSEAVSQQKERKRIAKGCTGRSEEEQFSLNFPSWLDSFPEVCLFT